MKPSTFVLIIGGGAIFMLIFYEDWSEVVVALLGVIGMYVQLKEDEDATAE